jgi:hypothetical protein
MELTMNKYLKRLQDFDNRWWFTGYHLDFLLLDFEVAPLEYQIQVTHDEAIMYCFSLNIDGKTGWRLPTFEEIGAAGLFYGNVIIMHYSNAELGRYFAASLRTSDVVSSVHGITVNRRLNNR